ncbi:MAG: hypothetical protein ACE1ZA_19130, partial [Pseudomonadales bacterium]
LSSTFSQIDRRCSGSLYSIAGYRYIEQVNGDHFLSLQSHRIEFLEALDEFLSEHLLGRI